MCVHVMFLARPQTNTFGLNLSAFFAALDDGCCSTANAISDIGVQALAQALVGDFPAGSDEDVKVGNEPLHQRPRRTIPILKTLDLGQVRVTWDKLHCYRPTVSQCVNSVLGFRQRALDLTAAAEHNQPPWDRNRDIHGLINRLVEISGFRVFGDPGIGR